MNIWFQCSNANHDNKTQIVIYVIFYSTAIQVTDFKPVILVLPSQEKNKQKLEK